MSSGFLSSKTGQSILRQTGARRQGDPQVYNNSNGKLPQEYPGDEIFGGYAAPYFYVEFRNFLPKTAHNLLTDAEGRQFCKHCLKSVEELTKCDGELEAAKQQLARQLKIIAELEAKTKSMQ